MSHLNNAYMSSMHKKGLLGNNLYNIWVEQGNEGTLEDFLNDLKQSEDLYTYWVNQGNTGTKQDFINYLKKSDDTSYQYWLDQGNTGTKQDFINNLKQSDDTLYHYWLNQGYSGTIDDFILFLRQPVIGIEQSDFIISKFVNVGQTQFNIGVDFNPLATMVFLNSALIREWGKQGTNVAIPASTLNDTIDIITDTNISSKTFTFLIKKFTATVSQTTFDTEMDFNPLSTLVFLNSSLIRDWSKSANNVSIPTAQQNDIIDVVIDQNNEFVIKHFDVSSGQTQFDVEQEYDTKSTIVFLNSAFIRDWYQTGNNVVVPNAQNNDIVDVVILQ